MDVNAIRQQIPVCQRAIYVNTGWSGPSPRCVVDAIKQRLDWEMEDGPTTPEVHQRGREVQREARESVAHLLNPGRRE
jgi:selenocysteine lyase/cysteine desulfurase